jgi:hypothetical protein
MDSYAPTERTVPGQAQTFRVSEARVGSTQLRVPARLRVRTPARVQVRAQARQDHQVMTVQPMEAITTVPRRREKN